MKLHVLLLAVCFAAPALAQQQPPQKPCTSPESRQFDFWVGDWDATWPAGGGSPAGKATNHVVRLMDGCVTQENFDGRGSNGLVGMSVSTYVARFGKWKQTWVDNQGAYMDFVGEFKDGQMLLAREVVTPKGQKLGQRMIWKNITPDAFDWSYEQSTDEGKTWQVVWPIHYTRRKTAADEDGIRKTIEAYRNAWLANDQNGVLATFTDDAVLLPAHGAAAIAGKPAIREYWFAPGPPATITRLDITVEHVDGDGALAFARGQDNVGWTMEEGGVTRKHYHPGTYLNVMRKLADGSWRIQAHMWDDGPEQVD